MSAGAIVWTVVGVLSVALLIAAGVRIAGALREAKRAAARLEALGDSPIVAALDQAEKDVARITAAADRIEPLLGRAATAIAAIRGR